MPTKATLRTRRIRELGNILNERLKEKFGEGYEAAVEEFIESLRP